MKLKLAYSNGKIFDAYSIHEGKALLINNGHIEGIVPENKIPGDYQIRDVQGANICPGLIDLQIYGTGVDIFSSELTKESLLRIDQQLLAQGCTSYMLTLATNTLEVFEEAIRVFRDTKTRAALGLHLEGPFLNPKKRGAHPAELIQQATLPILKGLLDGNSDVVKMMTIAPELVEQDCVDYLNEQHILLSAGHSMATYSEATNAFNHGVPTTTHLWNAMSPLQHREVGLPGAVFNHATACASIIVDGIHVDYEAVKISKKAMQERLFLITDAVAACQKGIYQHILNEDHYVLPDGTLSGSALTLLQAVKNCVEKADIPLDESLRMATLYPSRLINREDLGTLEVGTVANVLVFDENFKVKTVVLEGEEL
ncbi:N-acetylglucosamine-6-phosphate deacetylase [Sphingobacterium kyonggiense]